MQIFSIQGVTFSLFLEYTVILCPIIDFELKN